MSLQPTQPSRELYMEAFKLLRNGILLQILASPFLIIGGVLSSLSPRPLATIGLNHGVVLIGVGAVASIIGAVIALIGLYSMFLPGVKKLAELNPVFKTSKDMIRFGYYYGMILLLIGAVTLLVLGEASIAFLILATILLFIGYIGLIVLSFKLEKVEGESLYMVAGILFIVGIFVDILALVGWILLYIALGSSIRKHSIVQLQTQATPSTGLPV